ncbi:hypothetical protein HY839_00630 [Candidatus Azambacteria bacterium]|nr:hypothetical protein [Candidatus Azambacteria bacterium]
MKKAVFFKKGENKYADVQIEYFSAVFEMSGIEVSSISFNQEEKELEINGVVHKVQITLSEKERE